MGIREWLVEKLNPAQAGIASSEISTDPENIADYKEAFEKVEIIRRCIEIIINAMSSVPYKVEGDATKKVNKLLNERPNPFEDRVKFFRRAILDFFLDGNVFIFHDKTIPGDALFIVPANDVSIIPSKKTFVAAYEYMPLSGDQTPGTFEALIQGRRTTPPKKTEIQPIIFSADEIIHIKNDSQESIFRGEPRLKNLERLIELYYSLINFQRQFFKNNAIPGFVLSTDNVLSRGVKERLLAEWYQSYGNITKSGRSPAILDGGLKIDSFSDINFRELDFENSVDRIQQDMAKALGVPWVLVKSGNNANISQNLVMFYLLTVFPIMEIFASAFQHHFMGAKVFPDRGSVESMRPDVRAQASFWSTLVNGGIATPNEAREGLRLPKLDDEECNNIRVPQNIAGSATNPSVGGRPSGLDSEEDIKEVVERLFQEYITPED